MTDLVRWARPKFKTVTFVDEEYNALLKGARPGEMFSVHRLYAAPVTSTVKVRPTRFVSHVPRGGR